MKIDTGRVIAYGGGSGITALSSNAKAADIGITPTPGDVMTLLNAPLVQFGGVQVVVADLVSIAGVALVVVRLGFDIWKYLDERRTRQRGGDDATE